MKNTIQTILSLVVAFSAIAPQLASGSYYTKKIKVKVQKMQFTQSCNVRTQPKSNSVRVDYLTKGETFYTPGVAKNKNWYSVILADKKTQGYVSSKCFNAKLLRNRLNR